MTLQPTCTGSSPNLPRWRRLVEFAWPFVAIPGVLTVIFGGFTSTRSFSHFALIFLVNFIIGGCIGGFFVVLYHFVLPRAFARSRRAIVHLLLHLATITVAVTGGGFLAMAIVERLPWVRVQFDKGSVLLVGFALAAVIVGIVVAFERVRERARQVELAAERAQQQALRAQLEALQSRTNPHFLFNSLNAVASLIEEDPRRAERAVELLSRVMRYALDAARRPRVPLAEELDAVRSYLEVEQMRFGDRLRAQVHVGVDPERHAVPPLVLQPLVENAVLHGVADRREGGRVEIDVTRDDGTLVLCVRDDGPGPGASHHHGSRTALDDLRERLHLLHGDAAQVEVARLEPRGFGITVRLPASELPVPPQENVLANAKETRR